VIFGIQGHNVLAVIGALLLILLQLYLAKINDISLYIQDTFLVLFSIPLGLILEMIFIQATIIRYNNHPSFFPPVWIVCLYPLFALLINHSLKVIKKNYLTAFALGFFGAPLSYIAGISLGGLTFLHSHLITYSLIGIAFGLLLCLLAKIANIVRVAAEETLNERNKKDGLELLFDGECPICRREICALKNKDHLNKITFIDISLKDFSPLKHQNIDYTTAMSQIHAIEKDGTVLTGIDAFAAVYAKCQLLTLSTCLRIPFLKFFLNPLYTLFATKRLLLTGRNPIDK
jgi:predicted DCC family thiol-disulfide oxidoreductase YuxK